MTRPAGATMDYPLLISVVPVAASYRIAVEDARGDVVWRVHRKTASLGGAVDVLLDERRPEVLYRFERTDLPGFKAAFALRDAAGRTLGVLVREGRRSVVRERYDILDAASQPAYRIEVADARKLGAESVLLRLGLLAALVGARVDPGYTVEVRDPRAPRMGGDPVMRMEKRAAGWGTTYLLDRAADLDPDAEALVVLSLVLMLLRQRVRV